MGGHACQTLVNGDHAPWLLATAQLSGHAGVIWVLYMAPQGHGAGGWGWGRTSGLSFGAWRGWRACCARGELVPARSSMLSYDTISE